MNHVDPRDAHGSADLLPSLVREKGGAQGLAGTGVMIVVMSLTGAIAGVILGYPIITFAFWIGHSGTTGSESIGYSNPAMASLLALSGGVPLGAVLTPIVYHRCLRGTAPNRWWLLLPLATLLGGMSGAFGGPGGAAAGGGFAFWACAAWIGSAPRARRRWSHHPMVTADQSLDSEQAQRCKPGAPQ